MVGAVGRRVVHFVVKRMLQRFLKNLVPEQFTHFSLTDGFQTENLEFETSVINTAILGDLPLRLRYGKIGKLRVEWSLKQGTLSFHVSDVDLVVDYVPLADKAPAPQPSQRAEKNGKKVNDVLSCSLLLGDVNKKDVEDGSSRRRKKKAAAPVPLIEEDGEDVDFQSAPLQEMIDNAVQRMRVTAINVNVTIRFSDTTSTSDAPSPTEGEPRSYKILRLEIPWLEICDQDFVSSPKNAPNEATASSSSDTPAGNKTYTKKVLFQSCLIYLGVVQNKGEGKSGDWGGYESSAGGSVCSTPRKRGAPPFPESDEETQTPEREGGDEDSSSSAASNAQHPEVVGIIHSSDVNKVEIIFPGERPGVEINVVIESLHAVLSPKHVALLKGMFGSLSSDKPDESAQNDAIVKAAGRGGASSSSSSSASSAGPSSPMSRSTPKEVFMETQDAHPNMVATIHVTRLLAALLGENLAQNNEELWDCLLNEVRRSSEDVGTADRGGMDKTNIESPVDHLLQDHILVDSKQQGKVAGVIVRIKSTVTSSTSTSDNLDMALTTPSVTWRQRIDSNATGFADPSCVSSIMAGDVYTHKDLFICRRLIDFQPKREKDTTHSLFTLLTSTTMSKAYNVSLMRLETILQQKVKVRASLRVILYVPLLKEMLGKTFYGLMHCLADLEEVKPQPECNSPVSASSSSSSKREAVRRKVLLASSPSSVSDFEDVFAESESDGAFLRSDLITSKVAERPLINAKRMQKHSGGSTFSQPPPLSGHPPPPPPPPYAQGTRSVTFGTRSSVPSVLMFSCASDDELEDDASLLSYHESDSSRSGKRGGGGGAVSSGGAHNTKPPTLQREGNTVAKKNSSHLYSIYEEQHMDFVLYTKVEFQIYFGSKDEQDNEAIIGPLLDSILGHHADGLWLKCSLRLLCENCDVSCSVSSYTLNGKPVEKPGLGLQRKTQSETTIQISASALKLLITKDSVDTLLFALESPQPKSQRTKAAAKESNVTISIRSGMDPTTVALQSRVPEMGSEQDEAVLMESTSAASDVHIAFDFLQGRAKVHKEDVLLLIHLVSKAVAAITSASGDADELPPVSPKKAAPLGQSMDGAFPFALLSTAAALKAWQIPKSVVTLSIKCPLVVEVVAPMCLPEGAPVFNVKYPKTPPSHIYSAKISNFEAFVTIHVSPDPFIRALFEAGAVQLYEGGLNSGPKGFSSSLFKERDGGSSSSSSASALPARPIVRNYHSLYERSHTALDPSQTSRTPQRKGMKKGLRIFLAFSQCTPANPSYLSIRDRQDLEFHVVLNRMLLNHRMSQDANNWILVLTEFFTDVERVETLAPHEDQSDSDTEIMPNQTVKVNRLQSTKITVDAYNIIIEYMPVGLSARALIFSENIGFKCLSTLLSSEFRAEICVGDSTMLLDDGHFTTDLIAYDEESPSTSLFGNSLSGVVHDLELLGFIRVFETKKNSSDRDIDIVIRTLAPTTDCVPHLKKQKGFERSATDRSASPVPSERGDMEKDADQIHVEIDEVVSDDKPFFVDVQGGCLRVECCADSYQLLQQVISHYSSGVEQRRLRRIEDYYCEVLGLPIVSPVAVPLTPTEDKKRQDQGGRAVAAKALREALSQTLPTDLLGASNTPAKSPGAAAMVSPLTIMDNYVKPSTEENFVNICKEPAVNEVTIGNIGRQQDRHVAHLPNLLAESIASSAVTLTEDEPGPNHATVADVVLSFNRGPVTEENDKFPDCADLGSFENDHFLDEVVPRDIGESATLSAGPSLRGPAASDIMAITTALHSDSAHEFADMLQTEPHTDDTPLSEPSPSHNLSLGRGTTPLALSPQSLPAKNEFDELSLDRDDLGVVHDQNTPIPDESTRVLTKGGIPLALHLIDGYVPEDAPPAHTSRTIKKKRGDPHVPSFEVKVQGLDMQINLYGGKDLVTSIPPDAVHQKMKNMQQREKSFAHQIQESKHLYRTTRAHDQLVTGICNDVFISYLKFSDRGEEGDSGMLWRFRVGSHSIDVIDRLTTSSRHKVLTAANSLGDHSDLVMIEVEAAVPCSQVGAPDAANYAELSLSINAEPLRVNIDQDTMEFVGKFFATPAPGSPPPSRPERKRSSSRPPTSSSSLNGGHVVPNVDCQVAGQSVHMTVGGDEADEGQVFFRHVEVGNLSVKVDYSAKRCSTENLMKYDYLEILNLINIEGMLIELEKVSVDGCWSGDLPTRLAQHWWSSVNVPDVLSGVPTIRYVSCEEVLYMGREVGGGKL